MRRNGNNVLNACNVHELQLKNKNKGMFAAMFALPQRTAERSAKREVVLLYRYPTPGNKTMIQRGSSYKALDMLQVRP